MKSNKRSKSITLTPAQLKIVDRVIDGKEILDRVQALDAVLRMVDAQLTASGC